MQSRSGATALYVISALAMVALSFFATTRIMDYWGILEHNPLPQLVVNDTTLPQLNVGQTLDFSNGKNRNALLAGWSGPEPAGSWADGHGAFIGFIVEGISGMTPPRQVVLRTGVFLHPPAVNEQRVQVWVGSKKLAYADLTVSEVELPIPLKTISVGNGKPVVLGFYLPDAVSPMSLHLSNDTRNVSLFILSMQLLQ